MTEQKWNLPLLRSVLLISIPPEFVDSSTSFYLVCFLVSLDAPCHSARLLLSMCATNWENQAPGSLFILVGWFGCSYGYRARSSTQMGSRGFLWASVGRVSGFQLACSFTHRFDQPAVLMSQQRRLETCRPTRYLMTCAKHSTLHNLAPTPALNYFF